MVPPPSGSRCVGAKDSSADRTCQRGPAADRGVGIAPRPDWPGRYPSTLRMVSRSVKRGAQPHSRVARVPSTTQRNWRWSSSAAGKPTRPARKSRRMRRAQEEVGHRDRLAPELAQHRRERHLAGPGHVVDAPDPRLERQDQRPRHVHLVEQLEHRVEAHGGDRPLQPEEVGRGVAHRGPDDVDRPQDHRLDLRVAPDEGLRVHVELDQVAHVAVAVGRQERRLLGQEVGVVGARPVGVGAGEHHHLAHAVAHAQVEDLLGAEQVEAVGLREGDPRVVHDAEVDDGVHLAAAEGLLDPRLAQVHLEVLHVLGPVAERAAVDADHPGLDVEQLGDGAPQVAGDPGDHHGAGRARRLAHGPKPLR